MEHSSRGQIVIIRGGSHGIIQEASDYLAAACLRLPNQNNMEKKYRQNCEVKVDKMLLVKTIENFISLTDF
jgi:hypothetical protein